MTRPIDAQQIGQLLEEHAAALELYAGQWTTNPEDCVRSRIVDRPWLPVHFSNSVSLPSEPPKTSWELLQERMPDKEKKSPASKPDDFGERQASPTAILTA